MKATGIEAKEEAKKGETKTEAPKKK